MATFVFVAGGWHGGWCWKKVAWRLRALGHEVYTPSLTGLAERSHLFSDDIDLELHIADVSNLLRWEDLHDVNLVGHSYGGVVITGVADRNRDRVTRVVYFDALWPTDGDTVELLIGGDADHVVLNGASAESAPLLAAGRETAAHMGLTDPADIAWAAARLTPQPAGTLRQPLRLTGPLDMEILAIECTDNAPTESGTRLSVDRAREAAKESANVKVVSLHAPHDAMITHPDESTRILHEATLRCRPQRRASDR
jgi:pimeloyl-ACP methyl ester carboxylesterase